MKPEARRNPAAPYSACASLPLPPVSSFAAAILCRRYFPGHTDPCAPSQIHTEPVREAQMPGACCSALVHELHPCAAVGPQRRHPCTATQLNSEPR